jgi:hypothetical protein
MKKTLLVRVSLTALTLAFAVCLTISAWADRFSFSTGSPDGALGALSRPAGSSLETETADDFVLGQATVVSGATIRGLLIPAGTAASSVARVEVETYHVFPLDSNAARTPSVPTRVNSPSDVEIDAATRDSSEGTLSFSATHISAAFMVRNTVINGINKTPAQLTHGEGQATGEQVEIDITFTPPLFLPAGHYFFRPEVQVDGGNFLYLSAPRPIVPPGTPFPAGTTDLQAWIRNANLNPDWLRIGADIVAGTPPTFNPPTFNMTFSLAGNTIPEAGTLGQANCHGQTVSAMAEEFGGIDASASTLGYSSVDALQNGIRLFCGQ